MNKHLKPLCHIYTFQLINDFIANSSSKLQKHLYFSKICSPLDFFRNLGNGNVTLNGTTSNQNVVVVILKITKVTVMEENDQN